MIFGSYGTAGAPRPKILSPINVAAFGKWIVSSEPPSTDNIAIVGIHFEPKSYQGDTQTFGISWLGDGTNILIEDCVVRGYAVNVTMQAYQAYGNVKIKNINIRRNVIDNSFALESVGHSQGMFIHYTDGLTIEDNIFDHNGYKEGIAEPNWFNHNMYITSYNANVVVRNNITARASSHGLQLRCGGIAENNLFVQDPLAMFSANLPSHIADNVVIEGTDILSATPLARASAFEVLQTSDAVIENNIVANKLSTSPYTGSAFSFSYGDPNELVLPTTYKAIMRNNIVYNWGNNINLSSAAIDVGDPAGYTSIAITGNVVQQNCTLCQIAYSRTAITDPSKVTFSDNIYYSGRDPSRWFGAAGYDFSFATWQTQYYPDNSTLARLTFTDPNRNLSTYNQSVGGTASLDAFMNAAKGASRQNWAKYSASTVNDYIRAGFQ